MSKATISVGDNTPTGEPDNGPNGPYITDTDDGTGRFTTVTTKNGAKKPDNVPDAPDEQAKQSRYPAQP